ncbi:DUF4320 family protein [Bacillus wiedmannii]|uniref:DUF4320 domain-containing protein n=1 Tax=Bacillus wiedmannii TaxID=1890302 RepID=A0A2B5NBF1_9BACI|nr:DUF4320 family protein [Bacillus wiedmannii]MDM5265110.1 DUF4320 family protein [Bacillus wiedmannii]PEJ08160.1 DUF4320 domain-containing protein [Bacillus wiedmannii]PFZ83322.1 DUF4320 domain-containing protein [Bacillus wiedmannii]PHC68451.1 DUF4320 domain-containing protein [Bacillus wiedmannii]SCN42145.1 Protein of unknown function [Bacillus wiedmannii]
MQNTVTTALFLTLSLLLITLIPEGVLYGMQLIKAHDFTSSTVELAEQTGGFQYTDDDLKLLFYAAKEEIPSCRTYGNKYEIDIKSLKRAGKTLL